MRLIFPLINDPKPFPLKDYSIRPHLRRQAVAHAIRIFLQNKEEEEKVNQADSGLLYLSDFMFGWLSETLIQASYIREYHSWETEVKSYLNGQRNLNGKLDEFNWKVRGVDLVTLVKSYLGEFSAKVDDATMATINNMRKRINDMKHTPSFTGPRVISSEDYEIVSQAIEDFWGQLGQQQNMTVVECGPHIDKYFSVSV